MSIKKFIVKGVILFLMIFGLAVHPAEAQAPKAVKTKVKDITTTIQNKDWDKAFKLTVDFRKYYDKNKWKYQLMGDEQEYEGLANDIEKLKAAILAKNKAQALILTYDIREEFDEIFQL